MTQFGDVRYHARALSCARTPIHSLAHTPINSLAHTRSHLVKPLIRRGIMSVFERRVNHRHLHRTSTGSAPPPAVQYY